MARTTHPWIVVRTTDSQPQTLRAFRRRNDAEEFLKVLTVNPKELSIRYSVDRND